MKPLKFGDIVMITPIFYSESYTGIDDETYSEIVFCKVLKPIHNLYADKTNFIQSRNSVKACSKINHTKELLDNHGYDYCPFCGNRLMLVRQPDKVRDFIDWHDGLELADYPVYHLEY